MKYDNFGWIILDKYKLFDMILYCLFIFLLVNFKVFICKYVIIDVNFVC